jgi:prevent-host-death family protein
MATVGVFEAKNRLSELLERAANGEEITITRRGEPVARLVPPADASGRDKAAEAVAALREARRGVRLEGEPLRELIEEGRR